jgi:DNA primase
LRYSPNQLHEIRRSVNILDIISKTVSLKQSGAYFKGLCPFHGEKTPSFFVYPAKGYYICYGCGEKGDIIDYFMKTEGLSFVESVKQCADIAGISLSPVDSKEEFELRQIEKQKEVLYKVNDIVSSFFEMNLESGKGNQAVSYLKNRGLSEDIIKRYRLGYALKSWENLTDFIDSKGLTTEAFKVGLLKKRKDGSPYDFFRNRIMFPIIDASGRIRGFSSRIIEPNENEGKYINSPESIIFKKGQLLYGLYQSKNAIRKEDNVIIVEGNLDVISMAQNGFVQTAAPLGTAFTKYHLNIIKRFTKNITLIFDGDQAGKNAALKIIPMLVENSFLGKIVRLDNDEDPDSYIKNHGYEALKSIINKSESPIYTFIDAVLAKPDATIGEKLKTLNNLLPIWQYISDKDMYIEHIAISKQIDKDLIKKTILENNNFVSSSSKNRNSNSSPHKITKRTLSRDEKSELNAILYLLALYDLHMDSLPEPPKGFMDILNGEARDIWRIIISQGIPTEKTQWLNILGDEYYNKWNELKSSLVNITDLNTTFMQVKSSILKLGIKNKSKILDFELYEAKKNNDKDKISSLLKKKLNLQQQRIGL